jgi:hypothetical protein
MVLHSASALSVQNKHVSETGIACYSTKSKGGHRPGLHKQEKHQVVHERALWINQSQFLKEILRSLGIIIKYE